MYPAAHENTRRATHTIVLSRACAIAVLASAVFLVALPSSAFCQTAYEVVASFDGVFLNGSSPATLIEANGGNFYGTTGAGGRFGGGTVFRSDATGAITTLHHFSGFDGSGVPRS
jgi:uncharacterized repeat protein (TIGR03803 family)